MNDAQAPATRSFVVDGPPFVAVAGVAVLIATIWLGSEQPALGMAALAIGVIATLALDFREWFASTGADRRAAEATFTSLPARLKQARARQLEQDRWR